MATITNKTTKPLSVPLPGGKKLRLGPLNHGEIAARAIAHPPVQKLVEAGQVEIDASEHRHLSAGGGAKAPRGGSGALGHGAGIRRTGDR